MDGALETVDFSGEGLELAGASVTSAYCVVNSVDPYAGDEDDA